MSQGFDADLPGLDAITGQLRGASEGIEGAPGPPPAPEVGACTRIVAAGLALLTESLSGASESLDAVGTAVGQAGETYRRDDATAKTAFDGVV